VEIAARASQLVPIAKQDGLSNGAAAMEHSSVVSASQTVMGKQSCRRVRDKLKGAFQPPLMPPATKARRQRVL